MSMKGNVTKGSAGKGSQQVGTPTKPYSKGGGAKRNNMKPAPITNK
jgi:hypothetical protein